MFVARLPNELTLATSTSDSNFQRGSLLGNRRVTSFGGSIIVARVEALSKSRKVANNRELANRQMQLEQAGFCGKGRKGVVLWI
jgi:hypothetical protein